MNPRSTRFGAHVSTLATLLGSASLFTMAGAIANQDRAYAGEALAAEEIPENVLITGSLIRGTVAVGVPVINLSPMDFAQTGALTTADLFKNFPASNFSSGDIGTTAAARVDRGQKVNLRNLDTTNSSRGLMMVDGMRVPASGNGLCAIDPSLIPSVALDHIDILVDGASATYGSDAISGVINVILRRNYDGAQTQFRYTYRAGGGPRFQFSQLWGRTWDGGQITLSYEWYNEMPVKGTFWSGFGLDHSPWGYEDRTPLGSASPGIITTRQVPGQAPYSSSINPTLGKDCGYFNVPGSGIASIPSSCYSVPLGTGANFPAGTVGPTAPFSASTLNWATFSTDSNFAGPLNRTAGTRNEFNPYSTAYYSPFEERNGAALTVDQRLTKDISFYGSGFYSNRRSKFINSNSSNPSANGALTQIAVPTFNPYYPTGGAPTNLRVSYDLSLESPALVDGNELASRYQLGLNVALPAGWESQLSYAVTYDSNYDTAFNGPNKNAVSAALGWTILSKAPSGTAPSFGTWTKPASVPYLNLFCDPNTFQCNSATTLNYVSGIRQNIERWLVNEKSVKADGPLFDLPGGTVKAAIGADLVSNHFFYFNNDNTSASNLTVNPLSDALHQNVWAVFTQVNIPIFSDNNAIFGFKRFEVEASWRHDQYDTVGGTSNPKVSFNWAPIDDFTIKGSWGTSFRAPGFSETSFIAKSVIQGRNLGTALQSGTGDVKSCAKVGDPLPAATSGAGKLQHDASQFAVDMANAGGVGVGYTTTPGCVDKLTIPGYASPGLTTANSILVPGLLKPGGITVQGGEPVADPLRQFYGFGRDLKPEQALSWGIGFDYTPTNILRGLDIQATYYITKITSALQQFGGGGFNDSIYADPTLGGFAFPLPSNMLDSSGNRLCPDQTITVNGHDVNLPANLIPSACAPWVQGVSSILANPKGTVQGAASTYIYFVNDAATFNVGWLKLDGIDWNWSYDWDMGNIGAFNIGATGTYYLHQLIDTAPGTPLSNITDIYHSTVGSTNAQAEGVETLPRLIYRGRLGWSKGAWNVTGFMDYRQHYYSNQGAPTNVNNSCVVAGSSVGGGTFPCLQNNYTNLQPPWFSFDLSVGYDSGDDPANDYLKHIGVQMVIQNVMDKHQAYQYVLNAFPCACGGTQPNFGRMVSFIVTKTW
jgi:outer membrane receptor protein involved in Fe transport